MASLALRTILALSVATCALGQEAHARAGDEVDGPIGWAPPPPPPPVTGDPRGPIALDVQLDGAVGLASLGGAQNGAVAWRVGLDAEYWLTRNIGLGAQVTLQDLATVDFCSDTCTTGKASRFSLAPSIALRGRNPESFGLLTLALGVSYGHTEIDSSCDETEPGCTSSFATTDEASGIGPYGSLTSAWVFHVFSDRPADGAFALGPVAHLDIYSVSASPSSPNIDAYAFTFTLGVAVGLGVARPAPR